MLLRQKEPITGENFKRRRAIFGALLFGGVILSSYAVLPSLGNKIYASPDETANAVIVRQLRNEGELSIAEPLAVKFPWLHPRSFVSQGERLVPVGFLGWPLVVSLTSFITGQWFIVWLAALLMLSSAWPLFQLLKPYDRRAAWSGIAVAMTFPSWILYANRGLFSNGPGIALAVWTVWALRYLRERETGLRPSRRWLLACAGAGLLVGLSLAVRPTEIIWLAPWFAWAAWRWRPPRPARFAFFAGLLVVILSLSAMSQMAYGKWYAVGYLLHDNPSSVTSAASATSVTSAASFLPFGFHPRNAWWNVTQFYGHLLWPWTVLMVVALWMKRRQRRQRTTEATFLIGLVTWTVGWLLVIYGSGLYADHVRRGAVTLANSFLRYTLIAAPLSGWAFASLVSSLSRSRRNLVAISLLVLSLMSFGWYRALIGDDEGVWVTRQQVRSYTDIRREAAKYFLPTDVILSERSDKIFFPAFRAASPLPSSSEVSRLIRENNLAVGLFVRPLSQEQKDAWRAAGLEAQEVAVFTREKLYKLVLRR